MLNHKYRFHSRGGVKYVYKHGRNVRGAKAALIWMPNERGFTRVAVVVSKKVEKTAVGRNKIRRRVYEAIRTNFEQMPRKTDYIFVVYSKEVMMMPWQKLEEMLWELVRQIGK